MNKLLDFGQIKIEFKKANLDKFRKFEKKIQNGWASEGFRVYIWIVAFDMHTYSIILCRISPIKLRSFTGTSASSQISLWTQAFPSMPRVLLSRSPAQSYISICWFANFLPWNREQKSYFYSDECWMLNIEYLFCFSIFNIRHDQFDGMLHW